jgi:hypothetical protein
MYKDPYIIVILFCLKSILCITFESQLCPKVIIFFGSSRLIIICLSIGLYRV